MKREKWFPKTIYAEKMQDFANWINGWGAFKTHRECYDDNNRVTDFGKGYKKAITDVYDKLKLEHK